MNLNITLEKNKIDTYIPWFTHTIKVITNINLDNIIKYRLEICSSVHTAAHTIPLLIAIKNHETHRFPKLVHEY